MRDTYNSPYTPQRSLEQLIRQNPRRILEPEQAVVREHRAHAHQMCMEQRLLAERTQARVGMHQLHVLAQEDGAQVRQEREVVRERGGGREGGEGEVVHLKAREEVPDADARGRVGVGDDDDFVPSAEEVRAEHVDVVLDTADVRVEEV